MDSDSSVAEAYTDVNSNVVNVGDKFSIVRERAHEEILRLRKEKHEQWDAWFKVIEIESRGNPFKRFRYYGWLVFDYPVTWFRKKIVEPLHDKFRWPYYHRTFNRVRDVDQCPVGDHVCLYEANWQFRLDKLVDTNILFILRKRMERCMDYHYEQWTKCSREMDELQENELNFFIKYGEMGFMGDAVDCYMKQKHRMIWERRHPKLMQLRAEAYKEHKDKLDKGIYEEWFWKRGSILQFKKIGAGVFRNINQRELMAERDDISKDPQRLKEEAEMKARGETIDPMDEYSLWDKFP